MQSPQTIIVMYHYVRPVDRTRWRGLHPLSPAEFEAQLDFLAAQGDIVPASSLDAAPAEQRDRIVLTFDDGTRDHYDFVLPILRRRGLSALFGVMSGPTTTGLVPNVHLIHWLNSKVTDDVLRQQLRAAFGATRLGALTQARQLYPRDTPIRAQIKFALNFALSYEEAGVFLARAVEHAGGRVDALARDWYLTECQIREMHAAGMEFAVHAHRHRPFDGNAPGFYQDELAPCEQWLTNLLGAPPVHYIAAFGGSNACAARLAPLGELLQQRGYAFGFLTERGTAPARPRSFFLKRLDCADLPPRDVPQALVALMP